MKKTHTYHQLLIDYIEQIGRQETADSLPVPAETALLPHTWEAFYRVQPKGTSWETMVYRYARSGHVFSLAFRQTYPSQVVADIMGRYHCRCLNEKVRENKPSSSSSQLLN